MEIKRRNITARLETVGQVAIEHAKVIREVRTKKLDPALGSRLSAMYTNHRCILETAKSEERIKELEQMVLELKQRAARPTSLQVVR